MGTKMGKAFVFSLLLLYAATGVARAHYDGEKFRRIISSLSGVTSVKINEPVTNQKDKDLDFPDDFFTYEELKNGAVILHFIAALYSFAMIGLVCSKYFLPSVDCICLGLNLSQDVAAATFMSFATTAPELFTVLIGTFITESDTGLGAVIGGGMFNILGVATFGGLAAAKPIQLDWWPLLRDSSVYVLCLIALVCVIHDRKVDLIGASFLVSCYLVYFVIMLCNQRCRKLVKACLSKFRTEKNEKPTPKDTEKNQTTSNKISMDVPPVIFINDQLEQPKDDIGNFEDDTSYKAYFINYDRRSLSRKSLKSERGSFIKNDTEKKESATGAQLEVVRSGPINQNPRNTHERLSQTVPPSVLPSKGSQRSNTEKRKDSDKSEKEVAEEEEEFTGVDLFRKPEGSFWKIIVWIIMWPGSVLLYITIPDCRVTRWRKYYPLTFIMCVFWIGITSYVGNWMISVLGATIGIPDSVMGMTFLAAGGSMPEAFSTVIMARQGEGGLGFSNSLGGNTMDVCLCLGLPWLLKCWLSGPIIFDSESLQYNMIALFIGIFILLGVSAYTKFNMNRTMGKICCLCYLIYIVLSVLAELDVIPT